MKLRLLPLLLCATVAFAEPPRGTEPNLLQVMMEETIPSLDLEHRTLEQALETLRERWKQRHPTDFFPVVTTFFPDSEGKFRSGSIPVELPPLHDIPISEAIKFIVSSVNSDSRGHGEFLEVRTYGPRAVENTDWGVWEYPMSRHALAQLQVKPTATRAELNAAFERMGVHLEPKGNAGFELRNNSRIIQIFCDKQEQYQVVAVIRLLNAGYKVSK